MTMLLAYLKLAVASKYGQALLSGLRVALATIAACWMQAGLPISDLAVADVAAWVELGLQAGAALVLANWFGPWEKRYGLNKKTD